MQEPEKPTVIAPDATAATDLNPVVSAQDGRSLRLKRWLIGARFFAFLILVRLVLIPLLFGLATPLFHRAGTYYTEVAETLLLCCVLISTSVMAKLERKPFSSFGLKDRFGLSHFLSGGLIGFLSLTLLLITLQATHHLHLRLSHLPLSVLLAAGMTDAVGFMVVAAFEEIAFRGYALYTLSEGVGFWPGAVAMSLFFALAHRANPGEANAGLVAVFVFGMVLAFSLRRTGSLLWAIGFHFMWDYSESFLYGVPDSGIVQPEHLLTSRFIGPAWITGGSVGPEGSWLIFVILAIVTGAIRFLYPTRQPGKRIG